MLSQKQLQLLPQLIKLLIINLRVSSIQLFNVCWAQVNQHRFSFTLLVMEEVTPNMIKPFRLYPLTLLSLGQQPQLGSTEQILALSALSL